MFYDIFKELCATKAISVSKAATDIGLSNSTPTKWKKTGAMPDSSTLTKVSSYFNVPIDFLLGSPQDGADSNMILNVIADAYGISFEEAEHIEQILYKPEWREKCKGLGPMGSFAVYFATQKNKAPTPEDEREIGLDDFTYAFNGEVKDLTESDKQLLLSMARQLNEARKQRDGKKTD